MAKRIVNPISVLLTIIDGTVETRVDYGLECDDGLHQRESLALDMSDWTPDFQDKINDILDKGRDKAEQHEGL